MSRKEDLISKLSGLQESLEETVNRERYYKSELEDLDREIDDYHADILLIVEELGDDSPIDYDKNSNPREL